MTDKIHTECVEVHQLINGQFYYPMEVIDELMPMFDDITKHIIYLRYNDNFIDDEEKEQIKKKIESLKRKQNSLIDRENELFYANPVNEEELKKRKSD